MAKITVVGSMVIVRSTLTLEEIALVEKHRPDALAIKDEEGEVVFRVGTTKGTGAIGAYGVSFGESSRDDKKNAVVTLGIADLGEDEDIREIIADELGAPLAKLNKIESGIAEVIEGIKAEKQAVIDAITIA